MVNEMSNLPKGPASPYHISDSVGRHDLSFDGSENTNLFVEELLHKTEALPHPIIVSQHNSREVHLLTARRRLSLGNNTNCNDTDARKRAMTRSVLFSPPTFPISQNHSNQYATVRELPPHDQTKEWWKMVYGEDQTQCHIRTTIPRSAPSKSCMSSTKKKVDGHGNRTPNSVAAGFLVDTPIDSNTPLRRTRCVKFGLASAAEFEKDDPPQGSLTPMPPTKAALRFPTDLIEPDPGTADLIAMTKENSATLAEWDFFDDGEDNLVSDAIYSPLEESRRSRRKSGRFLPFCESDDSFAMDATETLESFEADESEMDVGKTCDMNSTRKQEIVNIADSAAFLVEMSSTATQLFANLAICLEAERQNAAFRLESITVLERELLKCRDTTCLARMEECLNDTLRTIVDPSASILQQKRVEYQLKSNPDLNAMIVAAADFHFRTAFTDALECITWNELNARIKVQMERVSKAIRCIEKAVQSKFFNAIAKEEESIKSLEAVLLAAQTRKESIRRRNLERQLLSRPRIPLTYYVMNFIAPFQLIDSSRDEIKLEFSTNNDNCRLQLSADIIVGRFAFQQTGGVDDGSLMKQDSVAVVTRSILSASCAELESNLSFESLPAIVFRVAQVLHRLGQFLEQFTSLVACCKDVSVKEDGSLLSVTLFLPDRTKAELVYTLSRPWLLDSDSFCPKVAIHHNGNPTNTKLFPPLASFLKVGLS